MSELEQKISEIKRSVLKLPFEKKEDYLIPSYVRDKLIEKIGDYIPRIVEYASPSSGEKRILKYAKIVVAKDISEKLKKDTIKDLFLRYYLKETTSEYLKPMQMTLEEKDDEDRTKYRDRDFRTAVSDLTEEYCSKIYEQGEKIKSLEKEFIESKDKTELSSKRSLGFSDASRAAFNLREGKETMEFELQKIAYLEKCFYILAK